MLSDRDRLGPYLERLQALPFVRSVTLDRRAPAGDLDVDASLELETPTGTERVLCEVKSTNLSHALAAQAVALGQRVQPLLVAAPVIGTGVADFLIANDINFVDLRGNCYINLGGRYIAKMQGLPAERASTPGAPRLPSYFVLFTVIANPELLSATVRTLAEKAGVSRQPAVWMREEMVKLGYVVRGPKGYVWAAQGVKRALDLWLAGYVTLVRPKLLIGAFRTQDPNPSVLESRIVPVLDRIGGWRWGGGAAAHRLTGYFRGDKTVVHLEHWPAGLSGDLHAIPDADGPLVLLRSPGPTGMLGTTKDTAHPLLVYSELLAAGSERARDAAQELADRFSIGRLP
jgi:hypothetical protein